MKKVRLNLDALKVVSFETEEKSGGADGTVHAHGNVPVAEETAFYCETAGDSCYYSACPNIYNTCGYSCNCVTDTGNIVFCH